MRRRLRPWYPRYFKDLSEMEPEWFPGATEAWTEVETGYPVVFVAEGYRLAAEDMRCWSTLHKATCMCHYWDFEDGWKKWIR